jgi:hypothetical protein
MRFKDAILFLFLCVFLFLASGCFYLVIGGLGAVGGYAVTRDTVQGEYDANYDKAWKKSQEICQSLGTVTSRSSAKGVVDAEVDRARVRVEVTQLTPEAIRVKVKARKGIFPKMETAEKVFVKIVQQLM